MYDGLKTEEERPVRPQDNDDDVVIRPLNLTPFQDTK